MNEAIETEKSTAGATHWTFGMLHVAQLISDQLEASLGSVGLSMAKHSALAALARAESPLTLSELAARLSCVRSNITQLVDRLETDGLVRRVDDRSDRRSVRAELTPLGREKCEAGSRALADAQTELSTRLSPRDSRALSAVLGAFD